METPWWNLSLGERNIFCRQADKESVSRSFVAVLLLLLVSLVCPEQPPPTHSQVSALWPAVFHQTGSTCMTQLWLC